MYLQAGADVPLATLAEIKTELISVMPVVGVRIVGWQPADAENSSAGIIVADITGDCAPEGGKEPPQPPIVSDLPPLASTAVADGHILPFAHVDCAALRKLIAPSLALEPAARREALYGRAIGRLIAHELYHIVFDAKDHAASGIAKAHFSARDLLSARLEFEQGPMARAEHRGLRSAGKRVVLVP